MRRISLCAVMVIVGAMLFGGCSRYVITQDLTEPIGPRPTCYIGEVRDELPVDFEASKKPSQEVVEGFRKVLGQELVKKDFFSFADKSDSSKMQYMLTGAILGYKKGSGTLRFFFGNWAGGAEVKTSLEFRNKSTGAVIFSGNFTGTVTSWAESGDKMFLQVAKDFAKKLRNEAKNMKK
ncbi:MAG: hypothetical protein PHR28_06335 [candidate division Zixibacteria bacterium]|nr:hypothetical protein [candidate division Zixibacteria bacterium]